MDESGVYDTEASQPTTESNTVAGDGAGSRSGAGGNKRDPISASPTLGATIAGRSPDLSSPADVSNPSPNAPESVTATSDDGPQRGGADTEGKGVTGQEGTSETSGHGVPAQPDESAQ